MNYTGKWKKHKLRMEMSLWLPGLSESSGRNLSPEKTICLNNLKYTLLLWKGIEMWPVSQCTKWISDGRRPDEKEKYPNTP
jgi:hypothetical protein